MNTHPFHLSMLLACRQTPFFSSLAGHYFTSAFIGQFLIKLSSDRPESRMPLYRAAGLAQAAASWSSTWARICRGPRNFSPTSEAEALYSTWSARHVDSNPKDELALRHIGHGAWKYSLVIQALIDPKGSITADAIRIALAIADHHVADRAYAHRHLASETDAERLARRVRNWLIEHPDATRGEVMHNVTGAWNPSALNAALIQIAEMNPGSDLAQHALELLAAARGKR